MRSRPLNYIFYGFVLAILTSVHIFHMFLVEMTAPYSFSYFMVHALVQPFVEVLVVMCVGETVKRVVHRSLYGVYIAGVCLLLFAHIADFVLVRLMNMSAWQALDIVLDETLENFIEMLQLTGVPMLFWIMLFVGAFVCIPIFALGVYALTNKIAGKYPLHWKRATMLKVSCTLPAALFFLDMAVLPFVSEGDYRNCAKALPFKSTIMSLANESVAINSHIDGPKEPSSHVLPAGRYKPNIYLFVVESLREDYLTGEVSPNVRAFADNNIALPMTFSNANATQISWFSLFYGMNPLHWATIRNKGGKGAYPLQVLKEAGYSINVYSAAQLKYYHIDEVLFGSSCALLEENRSFPHYAPKEACESDLEAFDALMGAIQKPEKQEGQLFIIFLDSTHFEYSWPKDYPTKYTPSELTTHVLLSRDPEMVERITNRYKNSIHFVDSLFGKFVATLRAQGLYDSACIVYTGDHGEEFYEEGQLYHASHLSSMQTRVPIYYKLGSNAAFDKASAPCVSSHLDVMPTLLHYVLGSEEYADFSDGVSILSTTGSRPPIVCARYNGARTPFEFFLHDGKRKCVFQFDDRRNAYRSKRVTILDLLDEDDKRLPVENKASYFDRHFSKLLREVF